MCVYVLIHISSCFWTDRIWSKPWRRISEQKAVVESNEERCQTAMACLALNKQRLAGLQSDWKNIPEEATMMLVVLLSTAIEQHKLCWGKAFSTEATSKGFLIVCNSKKLTGCVAVKIQWCQQAWRRDRDLEERSHTAKVWRLFHSGIWIVRKPCVVETKQASFPTQKRNWLVTLGHFAYPRIKLCQRSLL